MPTRPPVSVIETPEFLATAGRLMEETERNGLVDYLADNPTAGDLIPGTGGVRKLRWALAGRGKRGGGRVVYFYHSSDVPLFLLTVYSKTEQEDLSQKDRNDFRWLTKALVETFRGKRGTQ
jgi:hypothetical protein